MPQLITLLTAVQYLSGQGQPRAGNRRVADDFSPLHFYARLLLPGRHKLPSPILISRQPEMTPSAMALVDDITLFNAGYYAIFTIVSQSPQELHCLLFSIFLDRAYHRFPMSHTHKSAPSRCHRVYFGD